ncbi:MAG: nucleoside monophosphate kinase [Thermodesulfobacteriota bacterium]|nr:nucleoside monophosphate kinase [Thermodesulfobacteriota bacterium]
MPVNSRYNAILIVGPTGAGKTPLGEYLEQNGLRGRFCCHFDFGEQLRRAAVEEHPALSIEDRRFLVHVLETGALLENRHFYIAEAILREFARQQMTRQDSVLVMNGLPRHVDQAGDVGRIAAIKAVIQLECTAQTVCDRIAGNTGKDRCGRTDDDLDAIRNKLEIFNTRTLPLVDHYEKQGVPVHRVAVACHTTPDEIADGFLKTL